MIYLYVYPISFYFCYIFLFTHMFFYLIYLYIRAIEAREGTRGAWPPNFLTTNFFIIINDNKTEEFKTEEF